MIKNFFSFFSLSKEIRK